MEIRDSGLLSQTQRYEDGIEDAVVKNARYVVRPLLAAPSATVSSGSCAPMMDVVTRLQ